MRRVALIALVGLGCIPWPHHEPDAPEFIGVVTREGQPVAGLPVLLATSEESLDCSQPRERTITDAHGQFRFERPERMHWFIFMGDRITGWQVCFQHGDALEPAWKGGAFFGGPALQRLSCEVFPPKCTLREDPPK
jgi:hypothetical protein